MRYSFVVILLLITIGISKVFSQEINLDVIVENYLGDNEHTEAEEFILKIRKLYSDPVNINSNTLNRLLFLPFFTKSDIRNIELYIKSSGYILTTNELLLVEGFTRSKLSRLKGFIYSSIPSENLLSIDTTLLIKSHTEIIGRIQKRFDKRNSKFQGNMWKYYSRIQLKSEEKLRVGLTLEKDEGEPFFYKKHNGFDYYSAYLQLNYINRLKQINIGDYIISWGQGLIAGNNFASCKSVNTIHYGQVINNLSKYSSSDENRFFRGLAFKYNPFINIELIPVYSNKKIDARLDTNGVISLNNSGYHRTINELSLKDKANEQMLGMRVLWNAVNFQIGANYLHYSISPEILESKYKWKRYDFTGNHNHNLSFDYRFSFLKFYLFGESAVSKSRGSAHIIGTNFIVKNDAQICIIYRSYCKDFNTIYGNGFGESHNTRNEKGVYIGIEYSPLKMLKFSAYYDYFKFPNRRYRMSKGGNGNEYLMNLNYSLNSKLNIILRYKSEYKPLDKKIKSHIITLKCLKNSYRLSLINNISECYSFHGRLEYNTYKHGDLFESGKMFYVDLKYHSFSKLLKLQSRIVYFNTDSYKTRVYVYENDLLYAFSYPAYYYKGLRSYINISYKISKSISLYFKAGLTYWKSYPNKQDIKFQIRINI